MKCIGATLRDHVDHRTRGAAVLRRELVGDHAHLLNDVGVVDRLVTVVRVWIVVVLPVDHEVVRPQAHAVRREARAVLAGELGLPARQLGDARRGEGQREHVAAGANGQLGHARSIEANANLRVHRIEKRRVVAHVNRFGHLRRTDIDIDQSVLVDDQCHARPEILREPGMFGDQRVVPDREIEGPVESLVIGDDGARDVRVDVANRHGNAWNGCVEVVADSSANGTGGGLGERRRGGRDRQGRHACEQQMSRHNRRRQFVEPGYLRSGSLSRMRRVSPWTTVRCAPSSTGLSIRNRPPSGDTS